MILIKCCANCESYDDGTCTVDCHCTTADDWCPRWEEKRWNRERLIAVGTASISKAPTMTERPSAGTLTSGIHGFDLNRVASGGRRHTMTTLTSLVLIVLILLDMYIFRQLDKHEIGIAELLRIHPELWEEDTDDKRTSD